MKSILLLWGLLFFSFSVTAQTWKELNDSLIQYYKNGEYKKGIAVGEKAVIAAKQELGETNPNYATCLNNLALLYSNTGQYEKAESLFIDVKEIWKISPGETHPKYATCLNNLASVYQKMGQYEKAEPLFIEAKEIRKNALGETHPDYITSLNNLAILYKSMGQYKKAESFYIEAKDIRKKVLGETHPDYATSLNGLAVLYADMGQYEKAEPLYIESMAIRKKALGESHPDYAMSLNNLAALYQDMGQYEKAEALYIEAIEIRKKVVGELHPDYANSLNGLAVLYQDMGQYEKAESLYIQAKEIWKKVSGETHTDYALGLNNLAALYQDMGQYEKAEPLYIQAKEIWKKISGETHPDYAMSLNNLAVLYSEMGQYKKAEPLYLQTIEIRKKVLGEMHPGYATSLNGLAGLYKKMGQYEKAEPLYLQAIEIRKKALGETHPDYARSLDNLAVLYQDMGQYEKAEPLYLQAIEITKKVLGETHPEYATSLSNLAVFYGRMGQYEKAEPLYLQAIEIRKKALGETHPDYAMSLNNLAFFYERKGQYEKAEQLYIQAKDIWKNALGENHPVYASGLDNLASLYESTGQYQKAEPLILESSRVTLQNLVNNFTLLSEKEKGNYITHKIAMLQGNNSYIYNYPQASPAIIRNTFNQQLVFKSLTLSDTRNVLTSIQQNPDIAVQQLLKDWQAGKSILAKQYSLPVANRRADLKQVETSIENLEKELSRRSTEFRNQQNAFRISLRDVQKNLQQDEVAIEFVSFRLYNKKWTDSTIYAAYILHKNDTVPVFVPLCEEKQLGKYFSSAGGTTIIKTIYRSDPTDEDNEPSISGDSLYALVWKPLMPYLQGVKKINYSPAGLLYKIAFHALPAGDSQLLMDKYELNQYISVRQLALPEEKKTMARSITLFGNCRFSMDSAGIVKTIPAHENANSFITAAVSRGDRPGAWVPLSGTAKEITSIKELFEKNKFVSSVYMQEQATEEQFKSLSGNSPSIIHLATHGFFLPDPEKKRQEGFATDDRNAFTLADDPLLRSGIVLSGADRVWSGKPPIAGREDGIVTAYEIAQMDLGKTDLVVLSACETALGDIKGNEGVFGLQRAFKLAGVKNMLLSLWKVPDAETAELMRTFYTHYLEGQTIRQAFRAAQGDMRKKYKPYYWAAFVLIE